MLFVSPLAAAVSPPVILVLGDSLSAAYGIEVQRGWVALLQNRLETQGYPHRVVNASISGDTTASGRSRVADALKRHRPQWLILELGANDGLRGLSTSAMRANLAAIIDMARQRGTHVLLVGMHIPTNYGKAYTEQFHAVFNELAARYELPFIPFLLDGVALDPGLMQTDGLHPRAEAQPQILDNVWAQLKPRLSKSPGKTISRPVNSAPAP